MKNISNNYYPNLKEWSIECITKNKSQSVHKYSMIIPQKIVLATVDTAYIDENGEKQPAGEIMIDQEVPELRSFVHHFGNYFDLYVLERFNTIISFTTLHKPTVNDLGDIVSDIIVNYFKSYIPYPCGESSREQLLERCKQLEQMNVDLKYDLDDFANIVHTQTRKISNLKKKMRMEQERMMNQMSLNVQRMQEKIRELYGKLGESVEEECPVCYEVMKANMLVVPGCCHYICLGCSEKCDNCPLCREEYVI